MKIKRNIISAIALSAFALTSTACSQMPKEESVSNKTAEEKAVANTDVQKQATGFLEGVLKTKQNTPIISSPKDFGLDYEEVFFKTPDGVTLSGWLIKGGNDKVIIQSHTVTSNRSGTARPGSYKVEFSKTAKAFVDAGYSVLMFDARNHGQSERGKVEYAVGSPDDAPDYVGAVDYIASHPEYKNAKIGIHAQCFGVNATTHAFALENGLQSRKNLKAISLTQPASWGMLLRPRLGDAVIDEVNSQLIAKGAKDLDATPLEDASKINVPTLVIQNSNDPSGTLPFVEDFYNTIPATKEKWMIDGEKDRSYSYYHLSTNPEKLVNWFNSQL